jgi:hypothetical protein
MTAKGALFAVTTSCHAVTRFDERPRVKFRAIYFRQLLAGA